MATNFVFPDLGEGVTEGEIKKWLVKGGDKVRLDQSMAEMETDKAVVEMPSPAAGKVLQLNFKEGDMVQVGQTLAVIGEDDEAPMPVTKKVEGKRESISVVGELPTEEITVSSTATKVAEAKTADVLATPAVRKLAKDKGVEIAKVRGSGPEGRVMEGDIDAAALPTKPKLASRPKFDIYGWVERVPIKGVRRTTAKHMMESQAKVAAVTTMDQVDVTDLVAMREKVKVAVEKERGVKLTYMPFIIKAVVASLKAHPLLNSVVDDEAEEIVMKKYYNIGVAVAIDDGLIVPVVKGADQKSMVDLAEEVHKLAEMASARKLDLADLKGGTFTITNYGVFGSTYGTPIINYPEVAILGVGRIMDMPLVVNGEIKARKVLPLSLTFDHRAFDGAEAAKFVNDLKRYLESPELLILQASSG
jgi:pyruvate dehydrogenase E2 component (dihydrolipoamide acetyltransferase)